jgi:hypothetical protein
LTIVFEGGRARWRVGEMLEGMTERRREQILARFETATPEERGRIMLALWGYATAFTVINGSLAVVLGLSAVRIWRRRDRGFVRAVSDGGHWRTAAGFAVASAGLRIVRRTAVDRIDGTMPVRGAD